MLSLKKTLKGKLKAAKKVAILGIGSDLRSDDAAGLLVAEQLGRQGRVKRGIKYRVFVGATAPENLSGEIKKFCPTHLIVIDSADFGKPAGKIRLIELKELDGISFCTHRLPLKIMIDYLAQSINCATIVIGIQPKKISFGSQCSKEVEKASKQLSGIIKEILKG